MKRRIQFGKWLLAAASLVLLALPCAAQKREANRPPQQPRQQQPKPQRQERRQPQQENRRGQNNRPNNDRPRNNAAPNREPQDRQPDSMGMIGGNRPPNARESGRPNFNPNRPPNASNTRRFQDLSPQEKQKVLENNRKLEKMSPAERQELKRREDIFGRLTPEQKNHIKNDLVPQWQQMSPQRQKAIRQRLGVLQNMPESARNQHLNDPNFTRGMSEEDKAMLRDLSHMHVGAPDPHE